jgi:hypothetical protein
MFIENKYYRWYFSIIKNAQHKQYNNLNYTELHHIIPKSIGGDNSQNNLVNLTAREHFLCHWLLTKFTKNIEKRKMSYALWLMMNMENQYHQRYKVSSKIYSLLKENLALVFSEQQTGRARSEETKQKISKTRKKLISEGKLKVNENKEKYIIISKKRKGHKISEETKLKIGKAHKGKIISQEQIEFLKITNTGKTWSEESKKKLSNTLTDQYQNKDRTPTKGMLGKKLSSEAREKISKANKGKILSDEHKDKLRNINKGKTWKIIDGKRVWIESNNI